jgi:predicted hydrocarbon binding protein
MFQVMTKLIMSRQLVFEEGEIKMLGQNVSIMPVTLFVEMFKQLKKAEPKKYGKIIYSIAEEVGYNWSKALKKEYKMNSNELIKWDFNTLALAGLGKGQLVNMDLKGKKAVIRVSNSTIARPMTPSKEAVDFLIAGYIGGSAKIIFSSEHMVCEETTCKAKLGPQCEFNIFEKK